ncbi:MAG: T9SS type A sorting domain-containing protein [Bacteroidia bacterium]|nr:T9SS type A sorting domain-containing protein [Bacteroidia bacterium]
MRTFYAILVTTLFFHSANAQMTFTGGPINTSGQCWSIWASGDSAFMGYNEGLYRTTNGGSTWEHLTNGIPADVDPRTIEYSNKKLIVGTNDGSRIYQSDDFGDNFTGGTGTITAIAIPTASSSGPKNSMIGGTLFQPYTFDFSNDNWISTGGTGFVTTHGIRYMGGDTIWINRGAVTSGTTSFSHDNGKTWTDIPTEPQTDVGGGVILSSVAQDFLKVGNRILVGTNLTGFPVLYTDDYGSTWEAGDLKSTTWSDYGKRFIRVNDNHILTVNLEGIWKSTDKGETWSKIQSLTKIRTMSIFNGNHLLVGTDEGVCEFDNYGDGSLITKHGTAASSSRLLLLQSGEILAGTGSGIVQYNSTTNTWSTFKDTTATGSLMFASSLAEVDDTIFAMNDDQFFVSGDNGKTFHKRGKSAFGGQTPSAVTKAGNKRIVATQEATTFRAPKIYYSDDNGASYKEAKFSNNVSLGYGGKSGNMVEEFISTSGALIADMQAGYAISTDGGLNWTFTGGVWDASFLAVDGSSIYHYRSTTLPIAKRVIEVSTDNGDTWTDVPQTGLPNSGGSNYMGIWGIWSLDGKISTYNSFEETRGIYQFNTSSKEWSLVPGSNAPFQDMDGITSMHFFNDVTYANWQSNGTWKLGGESNIHETSKFNLQIEVYPNPVHDQIFLRSESPITKVEIYDAAGKRVQVVSDNSITVVNTLHLKAGFYTIAYSDGNNTGYTKLMKH